MSARFDEAASDQQVRAALLDFFDIRKFKNPVAVTLTMKQRVDGQNLDSILASENLRHFCSRLNAKVLGSAAKRHGKKLQILAVLETSADGRLHYHLLIDRPERYDPASFGALVTQQWGRTRFGYFEVDIQHTADEGWLRYILKLRQKHRIADSIDWSSGHMCVDHRASRSQDGVGNAYNDCAIK